MSECPICHKQLSSYKVLLRHLVKVHKIQNPKEFLANPQEWGNAQRQAQQIQEEQRPEQEQVNEAIEEAREEHEVVLTIRGIKLSKGDCIRVVISRNVFIVRVEDFSENLPIIIGTDIYGNTTSIDLRKALVITKITPEKYEEFKKRAKEMEIRRKEREERRRR
jgi:uncharacterized protein YueI